MFKKGALLILSGPSGSGKSTLIQEILQAFDDVYFSISTTTRAPRAGEKDGVDYFFVTKEAFEKDIERGLFLEWAKVHDNYYGTSLEPVLKALEEGKLVLFDIDVQGFASIMQSPLQELVTSVFITTPSMSELKKRLQQRGTDDEATIQKRLKNALREMAYMDRYDYVLINSDLERSKRAILAIARAARCKRAKEEIERFKEFWAKN